MAGAYRRRAAALAVHSAQATARVAATATTGGLANPVVSLVEDAAAFGGSILALAAPLRSRSCC